jgi:hypothetical protein
MHPGAQIWLPVRVQVLVNVDEPDGATGCDMLGAFMLGKDRHFLAPTAIEDE